MQVLGHGQAERAVQQDLARGVVGQVLAAHHVRDALGMVVHDHRQLVGEMAIGALQHEVAHLGRHVLLLRPEPAVAPGHQCPGIGHAKALGQRHTTLEPVAAGAGIHPLAVPRRQAAQARQRFLHLLARAAAGVGVRGGGELVECARVVAQALGLVLRRFVGHESTCLQLLQDHPIGAGRTACRVEVFDAHQPAPATALVPGPRVEPAGQRGNEGARMQGAGGGGREAAGVGRGGGAHPMVSASERPDRNASSTRWPMHQSPHTPRRTRASQRWLLPRGLSVCA